MYCGVSEENSRYGSHYADYAEPHGGNESHRTSRNSQGLGVGMTAEGEAGCYS